MIIKKNKVVSVLIFFSVLFSFQNESHAQDSRTLKVISYNIWNGFDWGKDEERKEQFVNWVNTQNPDVFALQELCGYTKEKLPAPASL